MEVNQSLYRVIGAVNLDEPQLVFPNIEINIREEAHVFLRRMKSLLDEMGGFETSITLEPPNDCFCSSVGFAPEVEQDHEQMMGIFVNWDHEYPVIRLQITARWEPFLPSYAVVREAAEQLFLPVVAAYNRRHSTRYRVRIESPEQTLPRLSCKAQKIFNEFAHGANKERLHPLDWQRFYRFVRVCHATRNDVYESDVTFFLRNAGFSSEYAHSIAEVFIHCRDFYIQSDWRRETNYRKRKAPRGLRNVSD